MLKATEIEKLFTREDGSYFFARWGRDIVPSLHGLDGVARAAAMEGIAEVAALAGLAVQVPSVRRKPNLVVTFFTDWTEFDRLPNRDQLLATLGPIIDRLEDLNTDMFRTFKLDKTGGVASALIVVRMQGAVGEVDPRALGRDIGAKVMLTFSEAAFAGTMATDENEALRPEVAALISAAYAKGMPRTADEPAHAGRLAQKMQPS